MLHKYFSKICIDTEKKLNFHEKSSKNFNSIIWIFKKILTIFNHFSRHDLAAPQILLPLFSLKFVDPVVILIQKLARTWGS